MEISKESLTRRIRFWYFIFYTNGAIALFNSFYSKHPDKVDFVTFNVLLMVFAIVVVFALDDMRSRIDKPNSDDSVE